MKIKKNNMKVKELINILNKFDPEQEVEINVGYEEWIEFDDDGWTEYNIQDSCRQGKIEKVLEENGMVVIEGYENNN